jgi:FkbM family methyltransferase
MTVHRLERRHLAVSIGSLRTYAFLLRNFRNGFALIQNLRNGGQLSNGPIMSEAVLWNGVKITHPSSRGGMTGTILEVWYENGYRIGDFYTPKPGDVILDVGAHVGIFSLWLLRYNPQCRIVALEPSPENFACLRNNIRAAGLDSKVAVHNLAIGGAYGKVTMMDIDTNRSFDARTKDADPGDAGAVDVMTIESLFGLANADRIALLKMDVEGAEYDAFSTAADSVFSRIDRIALEYHDNLKPGTLALLEKKLRPAYDVIVVPDPGSDHGKLFATRKECRTS